MDGILQLLEQLASALLGLLSQPFYYIGVAFVAMLYHRQVRLERKLFHTRLHSLLGETWKAVLWGWIGGLSVSLAMALVGAALLPETVIAIWVLSLILIFIRVRYISIVYAVGLLGILHAVAVQYPDFLSDGRWDWLGRALLDVHMPSLLIAVALLQAVEAFLVRRNHARSALPLYLQGKRGHVIGGYELREFWPVILFLAVPMHTDGSILSWSPLWGGDLWSGGWTVLALPAVIGFAEMTVSRLPGDKARRSAARLLGFSAILLVLSAFAEWWPPMTVVASVLCVAGREALLVFSREEEMRKSPRFVHDERGLMILAVLPSSPAAEMGIQAGEIIHKVNGDRVRTREEFHQALRINSAFCKLEILNLEGQSKFLQRAMFSDQHHQLGILPAPDRNERDSLKNRQTGIVAFLRSRQ